MRKSKCLHNRLSELSCTFAKGLSRRRPGLRRTGRNAAPGSRQQSPHRGTRTPRRAVPEADPRTRHHVCGQWSGNQLRRGHALRPAEHCRGHDDGAQRDGRGACRRQTRDRRRQAPRPRPLATRPHGATRHERGPVPTPRPGPSHGAGHGGDRANGRQGPLTAEERPNQTALRAGAAAAGLVASSRREGGGASHNSSSGSSNALRGTSRAASSRCDKEWELG